MTETRSVLRKYAELFGVSEWDVKTHTIDLPADAEGQLGLRGHVFECRHGSTPTSSGSRNVRTADVRYWEQVPATTPTVMPDGRVEYVRVAGTTNTVHCPQGFSTTRDMAEDFVRFRLLELLEAEAASKP